MEMFKNELTVGGKAIVIGVVHAENSHLIGKVVTVEQLNNDEPPSDFYLSEYGFEMIAEYTWKHFAYKNSAVVAIDAIDTPEARNKFFKKGYRQFDQNHLMPINPDATMIEEFEKEENPYMEKVEA